MKRIIKRITFWSSLTTVIALGILVVLILYPQNLFAKRVAYKNFNIYSNEEIRDDFKPAFDQALALVKYSELYEDMKFNVFLADSSLYKEIDTRVLGWSIARSVANNVILRVHVDFKNNLLVTEGNQRDLTQTIAHELVHCLQLRKYGAFKFNPLTPPDTWMLEGYPEYIAYRDEISSGAYQLKEGIRQLKALEENGVTTVEMKPGQFEPIVYFKGRIMIEYLMDIKRMTYDQVLNTCPLEKEVCDEMLRWANENVNE